MGIDSTSKLRRAALDAGLHESLKNLIDHAEQNGLGNEEVLEWAFAAGAEWQKRQDPSEDEVEEMAKTLDPAPWRSNHPASRARREVLMNRVRQALAAAAGPRLAGEATR